MTQSNQPGPRQLLSLAQLQPVRPQSQEQAAYHKQQPEFQLRSSR